MHPGHVATDLVNDIAPRVMKPFLGLIKKTLFTPEQGAAAILRLAVAPELAGVTGRYFVRENEQRSPEASYDPELQKRVWAVSEAYAVAGRTA